MVSTRSSRLDEDLFGVKKGRNESGALSILDANGAVKPMDYEGISQPIAVLKDN